MATATATASGYRSNYAIWDILVVPGSGDRAIVNGYAVIDDSGATLGDGTNAVDVRGGGSYTIGDNVYATFNGKISVYSQNSVTNKLACGPGSTIDMGAFLCEMGYWSSYPTSGEAVLELLGTAGNRATFTGTSGGQLGYYYSGGYSRVRFDCEHVDFTGLDKGTDANYFIGTSDSSGCYMTGCVFKDGFATPCFNAMSGSVSHVLTNCDVRDVQARYNVVTGSSTQHVVFGFKATDRTAFPCTVTGWTGYGALQKWYLYGNHVTYEDMIWVDCLVEYYGYSSVFTDSVVTKVTPHLLQDFSGGSGDDTVTGCGAICYYTHPHGWWHMNGTHGKTTWTGGLIESVNTNGNPFQVDADGDYDVTGNVFIGEGAAITSLSGSATKCPSILIKNNTFAMYGMGLGASNGSGLMVESDPNYPWTKLIDNISWMNTEDAVGAHSGYTAYYDDINYAGYNAFYSPLDNHVRYSNCTFSAWTEAGTPTYVAVNQFSLVGDQTATYTSGVRIQATLSGRLVRDTVTSSSESGGVTTVTMAHSFLDATLSLIEYSTGAQTVGTGHAGGTDLAGNVDPQFVDSSRNALAYANLQGFTGTDAEKRAALFKSFAYRNGFDENGDPVAVPSYDWPTYRDWVRAGRAPQNTALQGVASDSGDIGAMAVATGTTYDLSASDGVSCSEATGSALVMYATAADGVTITDTATGALVMYMSVDDVTVLSETGASNAAFGLSASDGVSLADAGGSNLSMVATATDGIILADSSTGAMVYIASAQDGISISEIAQAALDADHPSSVRVSFTAKAGSITFSAS